MAGGSLHTIARDLDPVKVMAALKSAGELGENELCPTDSEEATLVLEYAGGTSTRLLIETLCPSVVQPKKKADGDNNLYFQKPYESMFGTYTG